MIDRMNTCPKCDGLLTFVSGPIDDDCRSPDFVYCANDDCDNRDGYDPGTDTVIVQLTDWMTVTNVEKEE